MALLEGRLRCCGSLFGSGVTADMAEEDDGEEENSLAGFTMGDEVKQAAGGTCLSMEVQEALRRLGTAPGGSWKMDEEEEVVDMVWL